MKVLLICIISMIVIVASEINCTPGSTYQTDCNTCICSDDGKKTICTDIDCSQNIKENIIDEVEKVENSTPIQPQEIGFRCTPGSSFHQDCNSCICLNDGKTAICTGILCSTKFKREVEIGSRQVCKPKSKFNEYCNTCDCADDGLSYICTRRFCEPHIWNKDGTMKNNPESVQRSAISIGLDHTCKPGQFFKNDCNHCICDNTGVAAQCTVLDCSKLNLSGFHNNPLLVKGHHPRNRRAGLF